MEYNSSKIELISRLDNFASRLSNIEDINELAKICGKIIGEIVEVEYSGMYIIHPKTGKFSLIFSVGFTAEEKMEAERTALDRHPGWVIKNRKILHTQNEEISSHVASSDSKRKVKILSRLWLPILVNGESVGAYGLSSSKPYRFNDEHVALLSFVVNLVSVVYVNIKLKAEEDLIKENLAKSIMELSTAQEMKMKFLANMSHEIRTPLNSILGFIQLLSQTKLNSEQSKYLNAAMLSSENLLLLLNDVMDFSKIESGQLTVNNSLFSIREVFDYIYKSNSQKINKKVSLDVVFDNSINEVVVGDKLLLTQVLLNLITNAFKFTSKGRISLEAKLVCEDDLSQQILFLVTDTGSGIDKSDIDKIFEPFKQIDDKINREHGGFGLGLSIVKKIVLVLGGEINVKSVKGIGTNFFFKLNYKRINSGQKISKDDGSNKRVFDSVTSAYKILLVEDEPLNRLLAQTLLEKNGFIVDEATNGLMALEMLKKNTYDLILMDLQMPKMDGLTAAKIIRDDLKLNTPIIALTANAIKDHYVKSMGLGIKDFITKPFDINNLKGKILKNIKL